MAPHILTGKGLLKPRKSLNTIKIILPKSDFLEWKMARFRRMTLKR